jgi:hypothetical protein
MRIKKRHLITLLGVALAQPGFTDSTPLLGLQPVLEIAYKNGGEIADIQTMIIESNHEGLRGPFREKRVGSLRQPVLFPLPPQRHARDP